MSQPQKFSPNAGIAIGPILFVLALLALLAAVMASGGNDFQTASGADRITADIGSQANLIRNTINDCNLQYSLDVSSGSVNPTNDAYPSSDATNGTVVGSLVCNPTTSASLWGAVLLPPPTKGFLPWTYMDAVGSSGTGTGGRCIWTKPDPSVYSSPSTSEPITTGLTRAAQKFNSSTSYQAATEVIYDPSGSNNPSQKFIVWITPPTGSPDSHCTLP